MENGHILIVGGTTGSGRALVRLFAERCEVSLLGRHPSPEVEQHLPRVQFYPTDLADLEAVRATVARCIERSGPIAHLVFYQRYRGKGDSWEGELQVSLTATKTLVELCAEHFAADSHPSIVIVSSVASRLILAEQPVSYHAAKAAINHMMRYYAVTLGPKGIRVNAVSPDSVIKDESRKFYEENRPLRELYESITPLGRMGTAEDVAHVVEFLCSSRAAFVTGQEIVVDGGLSLVGQAAVARRVANLDQLKITR